MCTFQEISASRMQTSMGTLNIACGKEISILGIAETLLRAQDYIAQMHMLRSGGIDICSKNENNKPKGKIEEITKQKTMCFSSSFKLAKHYI